MVKKGASVTGALEYARDSRRRQGFELSKAQAARMVSSLSSPFDGVCPEVTVSDNLRLRHGQVIADKKL